MHQNTKHVTGTLYSTEANIDHLTALSWQVLQSMLYFSFVFSYREVLQTKCIIKRLLVAAEDPYKGYLDFCQRVMLAREKMLAGRKPTLCCIPSIWMNETFEPGFNSTETAYIALASMRMSYLTYRVELRTVSEALLELSEYPAPDNFRYWKQWFSERGFIQEIYLLNDSIVEYLLKA